ncbi:hypothetical protein IJ798_00185 [Candidatus Saccharibacteria bacterium]|nr:hypothetical protein [Candidatus Saccharibacteria bacterium]
MAVTLRAKWTQSVYNFSYTGGEQTFTTPATGYYKLEVWGAQGGSTQYSTYILAGGYGGYATGVSQFAKDARLYINVGGEGGSINVDGTLLNETIGYNGGKDAISSGNATQGNAFGGGGGATHIATKTGLLSTFSSSISSILIVAGGGGGSTSYNYTGAPYPSYNGYGGHGGGYIGNTGSQFPNGTCYGRGTGGTQSSGGNSTSCTYESQSSRYAPGKFGSYGEKFIVDSSTSWRMSSGGGGGYYGGGSQIHGPSGGGSGYIGSSNLISGGGITKHMTCYSCTTSSADATRTYSNTNVSGTATADYSKIGNGYARITFIGTSI